MAMRFDKFVERAFWTLLCSTMGYGVKFLGDMAHSVGELNIKVAVVLEQVSEHRAQIDVLNQTSKLVNVLEERTRDQDDRLHVVERTCQRKHRI